jgi:tetratricopeptide (TPR) repeat protein
MANKKKKKENADNKNLREITPAKRKIFFSIMFLLPFFLLILGEIGLRLFNYGGNLDLFIEGPEGYGEYLRCNPNIARRYFTVQSSLPTPPKQLFLKQKPQNGYRIFVLGESSAAGFPYGNNAAFPNILERGLSNAFPQKRIEVINVAFAAINSYTLLDLVDEVIKQSPDALLIYTGHNEYYGALGVGSVQSLGNMRWLVNAYLKFQSIKVFFLLRDFIGWTKIQLSHVFYKGSEIDPSATLMERIVAEQTIPYGSSIYEAGKNQFQENMDAILQKAARKGIPVVLSELVSNVRDQKPFISIDTPEGVSAASYYRLARQFEANGEFENAKKNYFKAKDYDALRFRAPEEFNSIIRDLAKKYSFPLVPTVSYFEKESPNGIIGNSLILEHLHPNIDGYFLLAKSFYETMQENRMVSSVWPPDVIDQERNQGLTELDSVYSLLVVQQLKGSWPFQPKSLPNHFLQNFRPSNRVEDIAFRALQDKNFSIESAHMVLGNYYKKQGNLHKAFLEYNALITTIPHEMEFYQKAATVLLEEEEYEKASQLLRKSLRYKENYFASKWIGQIALMKNEYQEAISFLVKADLLDDQVVFNLSRAYYLANQWNNGEEYYLRLRNRSPQSKYFSYLTELRATVQTKLDAKKSN